MKDWGNSIPPLDEGIELPNEGLTQSPHPNSDHLVDVYVRGNSAPPFNIDLLESPWTCSQVLKEKSMHIPHHKIIFVLCSLNATKKLSQLSTIIRMSLTLSKDLREYNKYQRSKQ